MAISVKTMKMLWGRAANRCAFPGCHLELVIDGSETDDEALVGDACHMVAESEDGPRGDSPLTSEERDKYNNLILLCKVHHKTIDDQPNRYTVEILKDLKSAHERRVRESLQDFDAQKQLDDERYADIVEKWMRDSDLENWQGWTYGLLTGGQPRMLRQQFEDLRQLGEWLYTRIWPRRYPELEAAFTNFQCVLNDLLATFEEHVDRRDMDRDTMWTEKFYRRAYEDRDYDHELDIRLTREYAYHIKLVQDLTLELTRAANYVSDKVRDFVLPSFRLQQGALLIITEDFLSDYKRRVEYTGEERTRYPYPGLNTFKEIRATRDFHFGKGGSPDNEEDED